MLPYSSRAFDSQECFPLRRLGDPIIAMMQPAEARPTEHATTPHAVCPACRSLFAKPKMCAVLMVVVDILGEKSLQVALVQRNYVVQQITPATLDPALRDSGSAKDSELPFGQEQFSCTESRLELPVHTLHRDPKSGTGKRIHRGRFLAIAERSNY